MARNQTNKDNIAVGNASVRASGAHDVDEQPCVGSKFRQAHESSQEKEKSAFVLWSTGRIGTKAPNSSENDEFDMTTSISDTVRLVRNVESPNCSIHAMDSTLSAGTLKHGCISSTNKQWSNSCPSLVECGNACMVLWN